MGGSRSLTVRLMLVLCRASGTDLGPSGGLAVAEAIQSCMQLTSLHLACMYCLAMEDIVVLRVCSRWCAMSASGGDLGTGAGATAVAAALENCTQLTSLNLACKWLGSCWRSSCSLVCALTVPCCAVPTRQRFARCGWHSCGGGNKELQAAD